MPCCGVRRRLDRKRGAELDEVTSSVKRHYTLIVLARYQWHRWQGLSALAQTVELTARPQETIRPGDARASGVARRESTVRVDPAGQAALAIDNSSADEQVQPVRHHAPQAAGSRAAPGREQLRDPQGLSMETMGT